MLRNAWILPKTGWFQPSRLAFRKSTSLRGLASLGILRTLQPFLGGEDTRPGSNVRKMYALFPDASVSSWNAPDGKRVQKRPGPAYSLGFPAYFGSSWISNELGYKDSNLDSRNQKPKSCHWTIPQSYVSKYGLTASICQGPSQAQLSLGRRCTASETWR